ncbi:hypothetical protein C8J36_11050 [Rhizobium sp. PP-F2F-G48]|uniref:hypothetical protein n=1 Tax=Rhizobium sp. PP-F2F-G48 TaxID=2135651 RepID=UPI001052239A|nr:hypothetical protein [Rhizobium sp. PP-F2F-G48]TCM51043.1 hypothetical protein C8J36_11050 [Rhizobium sp. PP-F2F-G48]
MIIGKPLFRNNDLDGYLRAQVGAIDDHVRRNIGKDDLTKIDAEIVKSMMTEARVEPLQVEFDNPNKEAREARVQVSDTFSGRVTIDGVRATRSFAFTGDAGLFNLRTNPYSSVLPYGEVQAGRVTIGMEGRNDPETLKREIDRQEEILRQYVGYSKAQVDAHNNTLEGLLTASIGRRRAHLANINDLASKI